MRAGSGANTNPSCREFTRNYKKLLLGGSGDVNGEKFNVMIEEADNKMVDLSTLNDNDINIDIPAITGRILVFLYTVCPRSLGRFDIVTYYIKWV